jgi:DNA-binding transcriptional regulator GbsR (MarR family)
MGKGPLRKEMISFVEDMGIIYEEMGLYRMAGRVIGWLLICDPPYQSPKELADVLGASKGAISTIIRWLVNSGLIEKIGIPGHRSSYYQIKSGAWLEITKTKTAFHKHLRKLAGRGLNLINNQSDESKKRLNEMHALQAFFEREIPLLLKRFEKEYGG